MSEITAVPGAITPPGTGQPLLIGPVPPPGSGLDALFGRFWPEPPRAAAVSHPRVVVAVVVVSLLAALAVPDRDAGVGALLVVWAGAGVAASTSWRQARPAQRALAGVFLALTSTLAIRDAGWAVGLCVLAAYLLGTAMLCRARSVPGMLLSCCAVPLAWLRGAPWLRRSVQTADRPVWPLLRTVAVCAALLAVFVGLFSSADAVFADWTTQALPALTPDSVVVRGLTFGLTAALVLGGAYAGVNPPRVERLALAHARPVRRFEWVAPVLVVVAVFGVFLLAQLAALFGGHAYLQRSTGLTYAAYVHQGFAQLSVASVLVLVVIGVTLRRAPRSEPVDRRLVRALLGLLGALALVVVASALYRVQVYEQAYGFTRLRLLVTVFEVWVGLVLLLAVTAGVWLRARWVPRTALLVGVLMLLGLTFAGPDGLIAQHNVTRYAQTGKIDSAYLRHLSDDAVPALDRLPEPLRSCILVGHTRAPEDALAWNLGRARAHRLLARHPLGDTRSCRADDS